MLKLFFDPMHWGLQEASKRHPPFIHKHKETHSLCTDCRIFRRWPFTWLWVYACAKCSMSVLFPLWLAIWYWTKCETWKQPQPSHYRELTELKLTWHHSDPKLTSGAELAITEWMASLITTSYVWWNTSGQRSTVDKILFDTRKESIFIWFLSLKVDAMKLMSKPLERESWFHILRVHLQDQDWMKSEL